MKKFMSYLITISLILSMYTPVFAAEESMDSPSIELQFQDQSKSIVQLESSAFFNYMSLIFENPNEYRAISKSGDDITEDFCSRYLELYQSRTLHPLKDISDQEIAWIENIVYIDSDKELVEPYATTSEDLLYVIHTFPCISNIALNYEFAVKMLGGYSYNPTTKKITEGDYPAVDITYYSGGIYGTLTISNLVRHYYIIENGKKIQFTASFAVYRTASEWTPVYGGTFALQMVGDSNGETPVEYSPTGYAYPID